MSVRFNPPPLWLQHLPAGFQPTPSWVPETAWGAPPAGWPMWVHDENGHPAMPPQEFSANPYLYMAVMPGTPAFNVAGTRAPSSGAAGGSPSMASFKDPGNQQQNKPKRRGKKIWIAAALQLKLAIKKL